MKTIKIKDYYGIYQEVPVSDELYEEFRGFHREEDRQNKKKNYHGCFVPYEDIANELFYSSSDPLADEIIRQEENRRLYQAIAQLTPTQRRRILMIMNDMKYCDIAAHEGKCVSAIHESVDKALKKLRRLLTE